MTFLKIIAVTSLLTLAASANAALFTFDVDPVTGGHLGNDKISNIVTSFDSTNQRFTWSSSPKFPSPTVSDQNIVDGFWLVVNNGPNPKNSNVNELAIMYGDLEAGVLSTYIYNGQNNAGSINSLPGNTAPVLLQTDVLSVDSITGAFSFDIDTQSINNWALANPNVNNTDYTGIAFDDKIGIWFHFSSGSDFTYNTDGDITGYSYDKQGWYDVANEDALQTSSVEVSAPSIVALFGLAFAGLLLVRRQAS